MAANREKEERIFTVAQLNALIKVALDASLPPRLTVVGEISDWKRHAASGHCYFSLKDETSVLPAVMWKSSFAELRFTPENGMQVLARGHIDVYPPQGKYQFYVDRLEPAGKGALQLAFEQMKARLEKEGLFDPAHKKPLPQYPFRIGIVTSESGAALQDIRESIQKRWPPARLFLYPVSVQGEGAAEEIASAIRDINRRNNQLRLDVLIVGRGGGSPEDLWAFNEEAVARAIYDSKIPVISAVGHETDFTIADFVADRRASTPTRAAVEACPDIREVMAAIATAEKRLRTGVSAELAMASQRLKTVLASTVFRNPRLAASLGWQRLDEVAVRLGSVMKGLLAAKREHTSAIQERISRIEPRRVIADRMLQLVNAANSMAGALRRRAGTAAIGIARCESSVSAAVRRRLSDLQLSLAARENRLAALDPRSVLTRGYSITRNKQTGKVVTAAADVRPGEFLLTELADRNLIESQVKARQNGG
jgi:exodeoxyribonuclease VII large subunit